MFDNLNSYEKICPLLCNLNPKNFASPRLWELEVLKMVKNAESKTTGDLAKIVADAKEGNYWGAIYSNGVIAPFGVANYLAELYSIQIFVKEIWPRVTTADRPSRKIEEFTDKQNIKFLDWCRNEYRLQVDQAEFISVDLLGKDAHIQQLRIVGLARPKPEENFMFQFESYRKRG
jgi:hypothetical protein